MTAEAPALIQYACERCKTRFILPANERKLGMGGRFRAVFSAGRRVVGKHEGFGTAYDSVKQKQLAKMDDQAYQEFVQSFRFCHECRQFVCNECWSNSRKACLTCVAKSMAGEVLPRTPFEAPMARLAPAAAAAAPVVAKAAVARPRTDAPRKLKWRRQATSLALVVTIVLLGLEGFFVLSYGNPGPADANAPGPTDTPGLSATPASTQSNATAAVIAGGSGTADNGSTPSATDTSTATDTSAASGTVGPSPTPMPQLPDPNLTCSQKSNSCTIRNFASYPDAKAHWSEAGSTLSVGQVWYMKLNRPGKLVQVFVTATGYRDSIAQTWREGSNETPQPTHTIPPITPPPATGTPIVTPSPTGGATATPAPTPTDTPITPPPPIEVTVTAAGSLTVVYGNAPTYTVHTVPTAPAGGWSCTSDYVAGDAVGSVHPITCSGPASDGTHNYTPGGGQDLTVTTRPVHVTVSVDGPLPANVGDPMPGISFNDNRWNSDPWQSAPTCGTDYDGTGVSGQTYHVTCSGADAGSNYQNVTYNSIPFTLN